MISSYSWVIPGAKAICKAQSKWMNEAGEVVSGPIGGEIVTVISSQRSSKGLLSVTLVGYSGMSYRIEVFEPLDPPKKLPHCISALLTNPKRVIVPDKFDIGKSWEVKY